MHRKRISKTMRKMSNGEIAQLYAMNGVLMDLYFAAWDGSTKALQDAGLRDGLDTMTRKVVDLGDSVDLEALMAGERDEKIQIFLVPRWSRSRRSTQ